MASLYFTATDYCIMVFTMLSFFAIGLYYRFSGGRQKTTEEYLMANRNLSVLPVSLSLVVSFTSAITILGYPAEFYSRGSIFMLAFVSGALSTPIAVYVYLPVFFNLQKVSTYEYLELRFGPSLRLLGSLIFTVQQLLYHGVVLYAPAITLESITGLSKLTSILLTGLLCMFYSTIGGMKAVVMTDVLQSLIMTAAVISIIIFAAFEVGGLGNILDIARENGRLSFNNFNLDPTERHTFWNLILGGAVSNLVPAVNHIRIQRLLTVKTLREAQICGILSMFLFTTFALAIWLTGLALYAVYSKCDPVADRKLSSAEQLVPYYVVTSMQRVPGLAGLFIAGILSATLSSLSAASNSVAALVTKDYIPYLEKRLEGQSLSGAIANKIIALGAGLLFVALAFLTDYLGGLFHATMSIHNAFGGPVLGVFSLGLFTTTANEKGTIIGFIVGLVISLWQALGGPRPPIKSLPVLTEGCFNSTERNLSTVATTLMTAPTQDTEYFYFYRISYLWLTSIGFLSVILVGYIASKFIHQKQPWENNEKDALPDPSLFTPLLAAKVRRRNEEIRNTKQFKEEMTPLKEVSGVA